MKEVNLLKYEFHSIKLDPETIGLQDIEGDCSIEITKKISSEMEKIEIVNPFTNQICGEIDIAKGKQDLEQARKNGSHIIYATILIEHKLNDIIANYFFGKSLPNPKRDFFVNHILCASHITYAAKKALALDIIDKCKPFDSDLYKNNKQKNNTNKEKSEFDNLLKKVMNCRNAFAHGKLRHEASIGCVLDYYSGGHKTFTLTDDFWAKLEDEYTRLETILKDIATLIE